MSQAIRRLGRRVLVVHLAALATSILGSISALAWQGEPIDFQKAQRIRQRFLAGEAISKDDHDYLERAKAAFQKKQAGRAAPSPRASVGLTPLNEPGEAATRRYKGSALGLYGEGRNTPPEPHMKLAMDAAGEVQPLDAGGRPSKSGKIGLISIGMSNTTQEFSRFMALASREAALSPRLVIVDGAQGGMEGSAWAEPEKVKAMNRPDPWGVLDDRISREGLWPKQVQVAWIKQARAAPASLGEYPRHAEALRANLATAVLMLKRRFPNLRLVYLSSRIYAGYATNSLNPEPYAYEGAFAVRDLIRDQMDGKTELNADPAKGDVRAPVMLWGPYLWADGMTPRSSDRLVWTADDFGPDGTHPSPSGREKVAGLLFDFFRTDPTARGWFLARP